MSLRSSAFALAITFIASKSAFAADQWSTPHPGARKLFRTTSTPWRIHALEIDLCAQGVSLRATKSSERKRTVSSFAKLVGAEAAVNGDFFSFSTYATSGLAMGGGVAWSDTADQKSSGLLAFGYDRLLLSAPAQVVDPPAGWMREVVSGRPQVVTAGVAQASDPTEFCSTRHPRTAAGLSEDRRTLFLVVVDGRTSISVGMRCTELGKLMKELGAHDAINLDGGGSSAMYVAGSGVVNDPSDGVERVVANHLAVFASGSGEPGSCDRSFEESATASDAYDGSTTTDVDGDGLGDVCARSSAGITCALSNGTSFAAPIAGPAWSDDSGWNDDDNWATLRMGDLDGDGRADVCARANAGIRCHLSESTGFSGAIQGPELSDASGWSAPRYHGTLRMADVNGDGKDDLCARSSKDFRCWPSTGAGFDAPFSLAEISDAAGFDEPSRYGTIRMGDVNGDGMLDVCARASSGVRCWPSTGTGFGAALEGPAWSDSGGWGFVGYWSTIRLADVDGDGRADLCARAAKGVICHLSEGTGFGPEIAGPTWSDASGWARHRYFSTLRFADLDGDGDLEVCARAAKGIVCAPWESGGFGAAFDGPALSNDNGWAALRFYQTIRFVDIDGDRRADLCVRASAGVRCWPSLGTSFGAEIVGPEWSDAKGWDEPRYFSTLRAAGPRCIAAELCGNGADDDCNGTIDDGCDAGSGGTSGSSGVGGWAGGGGSTPPAGGTNGSTSEPADGDAEGSCACRATGAPSRAGWLWAALSLAASGARRRRPGSSSMRWWSRGESNP